MHWYMKADELAVVQGWGDTVTTLRRWNRAPWGRLAEWSLGSLAVTALLLLATWYVARLSHPDATGHEYPGLTRQAVWGDFGFVLYRNSLVLALHALACLAGFIASTARGRGQESAARLAIGFVAGATLFSLATQAFALGHTAADLAHELGVSPLRLLVTLTPHAVPELFAVFLPLAAWTLAARRGAWNELMAATLATTTLALPILVLAAAMETWLTPRLLVGLGG
jgi:hypothetical protein